MVQTFGVGLGHSEPAQKDRCVITLLREVGFHPRSTVNHFLVLSMVLSSRWKNPCNTKCLSTGALFPGGEAAHPDVLWFYLVSAAPLFPPVSTNSKSAFLPNVHSTTWTSPKCTFLFPLQLTQRILWFASEKGCLVSKTDLRQEFWNSRSRAEKWNQHGKAGAGRALGPASPWWPPLVMGTVRVPGVSLPFGSVWRNLKLKMTGCCLCLCNVGG